MSVSENIIETCSQMGTVDLSGVNLESAHKDLLDINTGSLDQHVAMQPSAIAYYGFLKKEAKRNFDAIVRQRDRWERQKYAEAKVAVESGTTSRSTIKVEEIKARMAVDNGKEMEQFDKRVDMARAQYDTLDIWLEAWRQKSFSMHEFVSIVGDEYKMGSSSIRGKSERSGDTGGTNMKRIRSVLEKRRGNENGGMQ